MPVEPVYLTPEGLEEKKKELDHLVNVRRQEIADAIQQAKEFGDLSENAEYENAKNQQAFIEGRIATLEKMIANAVLITKSSCSKDCLVQVGSTVEIKNASGKKQTYTIVGSAESDPLQGKISNESPLGKSLLGHQVGDTVEVPTPSGLNEITITAIS